MSCNHCEYFFSLLNKKSYWPTIFYKWIAIKLAWAGACHLHHRQTDSVWNVITTAERLLHNAHLKINEKEAKGENAVKSN